MAFGIHTGYFKRLKQLNVVRRITLLIDWLSNEMQVGGNILSGILGVGGFPGIRLPNGPLTYYDMDLSPEKFPILEWAYVYKTRYFEGNPDFNKEILDCRGESNCIKYILKSGKGAGSFVLFDSQKRLAEIFTTKTGNIVYTYQEYNVQLPNAMEMPFMPDMFNNK